MFIQIKNIWYYYVYIHKLKLSINCSDQNITATPHAERGSMFTRQISDTRLRERHTPNQSEDPNPTTPTNRQEDEKGKHSRRLKEG